MTDTASQARQRHWDDLAGGYEAAKARNATYFDTLKAMVDRSVPPQNRGRVLEVGCGTGGILASLSPVTGLGIDLSRPMVESASARYAGSPNLSFAVMDAAAAAEAGGAGEFDGVICTDVLEHVEDWRAAVVAIAGACSSNGVIVIATPNPVWALPLWILEKLRLKMPEGPHRYVHRRAIVDELTRLGCRVTHCGTALICPARLWGLGPAISGLAARVPVLRSLGVIQCVRAVAGETIDRPDAEAQRKDS